MDVLERGIRDRLAAAGAEMGAHPYRGGRAMAPGRRTLRPLLAAVALAVAIAGAGTGLGLHSRLTGHRPSLVPATTPSPAPPTAPPTAQPTPTPLPAPHGMSGAATVWDSAHRELLVVGSVDTKGGAGDPPTWTWDGTWHEQHPATSPDTGGSGLLVDMPPLGGAVWLGTPADQSGGIAELWTGSAWRPLAAPGYPSDFQPVAAAYDEQRHQAVVVAGPVVGGCGACGTPAPPQTWTWNGRTWTRHGDAVSNLIGGTAAWDPDARSVVMLSTTGSGGVQALSWNGTAWTRLGSPGAIQVGTAGLAWDAGAGALVLYSDAAYDRPQPVTVLFRNGRWQTATIATYPEQLVAVVSDTTRRRALLVGLAPISITQTPVPSDDQNDDVVLGWTGSAWVQLATP